MAVWALAADGSVRIGQSVPPSIEYTRYVTPKAKPLRGAPAVLAALATVALHALLLEQVMTTSGPAQPPPVPAPIRVDMLTTQSTVPVQEQASAPPHAATETAADQTPAPVRNPRAPAPLSRPIVDRTTPPSRDPMSTPHSDPVVAVGADEFSTLSTEAGGVSGDPGEDSQTATLAPRASEQAVEQSLPVAESLVTDLKNQGQTKPSTPLALEGRWRYQVFYGEYSGSNQVATLDYVLSIQGGRYRLHTEGQALGLLSLLYRGHFTQVSEGDFDDEGFRSERYQEQRGNRAPRMVKMDSQGDHRMVTFEDGRTEATSALAQDRLSLAAQLAWLAARRASRLNAAELTLPLVGVSSIRVLRFLITPAQILEMPGGVRQLTRLRSEDGDGERSGSLEIWLSESGDLMPIRIRLEDRNGQVLDQVIAVN